MPIGTASARLRKLVIFDLLSRLGENICFQCGETILKPDQLSVEHKKPYLHSSDPVTLFFSLKNIAFSHLRCNVSAANKPTKGKGKHPSMWAYLNGCRCDGCKSHNAARMRKIRAK
jgi:hypothetical protein